MNQDTPPTIDDVAVILPGLVRALGLIIEQMEPPVDLSCRATNLPEGTADRMSDHAHTLMREAAHRLGRPPRRARAAFVP